MLWILKAMRILVLGLLVAPMAIDASQGHWIKAAQENAREPAPDAKAEAQPSR